MSILDSFKSLFLFSERSMSINVDGPMTVIANLSEVDHRVENFEDLSDEIPRVLRTMKATIIQKE